jgi:hypothetical protein
MSYTRRKICELPEDGQELTPKHIGVIFNEESIVQQVGAKHCVCNVVARNMYSIKLTFCSGK